MFYELVLDEASSELRVAPRAGQANSPPVFYPLSGTTRSFLEEQLGSYKMVGALWRAKCVPTAAPPPPPAASA